MSSPKVAILTVGDELLKGQTLDTNSHFLSKRLSALGFQVTLKQSVGDSEPELLKAIRELLSPVDLLIVSGGLGPTLDDVTRLVMGKAFGLPLEVNSKELKNIQNKFPKQAKSVPDAVREQATYPKGADLLNNSVGVAKGIWIKQRGKVCVAIPGVPGEARAMMTRQITPRIKKEFPDLEIAQTTVLKTLGQNESFLLKKIGKNLAVKSGTQIGVYPSIGEVVFRIQNHELPKSEFKKHCNQIKLKLKPWIYADKEISLPEEIIKRLRKKKWSLALAESCTGGLLGKNLTDVEGASKVIKGGVIAYSNKVKEKVLGVDKALLVSHGAVSSQVARVMAKNAASLMGADLGVSITGIAGPGGGSKEKPVGLVYIGISHPTGLVVKKYIFQGNRSGVRQRSLVKALQLIYDRLS
jgi:nicotinamide-nucleotide amidase